MISQRFKTSGMARRILVVLLLSFNNANALESPTVKLNNDKNSSSSVMIAHSFRLKPGTDLLEGIEAYVKEHKLRAAVVISVVGSVKKAKIRFSDAKEATEIPGPFEIVSLVGTSGFGNEGGRHFHIAVSDRTGKTMGGHLVEGCPIYTTAEVVLGELKDLEFARKVDPETTYKELVIRPAN